MLKLAYNLQIVADGLFYELFCLQTLRSIAVCLHLHFTVSRHPIHAMYIFNSVITPSPEDQYDPNSTKTYRARNY